MTSAILHSTVQPTTSGSGTPGAGLLFHIFWSTITNMMGWVGLTPMRMVFLLGGLLVIVFVHQVWRAATGRHTWSLNERDAELSRQGTEG